MSTPSPTQLHKEGVPQVPRPRGEKLEQPVGLKLVLKGQWPRKLLLRQLLELPVELRRALPLVSDHDDTEDNSKI